jgi:protein-disulfide isomerase
MIKKPLIRSSQIEDLKKELNQFKFDMESFNQRLLSHPKFAVADDLNPIILGNSGSKNIITIVSNPFCNPCARAHKMLDNLIRQRDDVQIKVIFATPDLNDSPKAKMSKHFIALNKSHGPKVTEKALSEWYNDPIKNHEMFQRKFPATPDDECRAIIAKQKDWCTIVEIKGTPTILFNGYKLPRLYDADDLKYLLS